MLKHVGLEVEVREETLAHPVSEACDTRTTWNQLCRGYVSKICTGNKKIITTIVVDIYQAFNAKPFMEVILPNLCHKPHKLGTDTIILIGGMWAKSRLKDLSKVSYLLNRRT